MIITYPPGGNTDLVGRALAQKLSESLAQQVVVDNRGGAGGLMGTMITTQSAPDGYTIMLGTSAGMVARYTWRSAVFRPCCRISRPAA